MVALLQLMAATQCQVSGLMVALLPFLLTGRMKMRMRMNSASYGHIACFYPTLWCLAFQSPILLPWPPLVLGLHATEMGLANTLYIRVSSKYGGFALAFVVSTGYLYSFGQPYTKAAASISCQQSRACPKYKAGVAMHC